MAGFQVSTGGRIWVSTEVRNRRECMGTNETISTVAAELEARDHASQQSLAPGEPISMAAEPTEPIRLSFHVRESAAPRMMSMLVVS